MIRIQPHPAPLHYEESVQKPGVQFLRRNPHPTSAEYSRHAYWRAVHDDLYTLYSGVCAYCASWTPHVMGKFDHSSVDHFIPKALDPRLAYEWSNFRLCRARLNANKGDSLDVMDPLHIRDGWFTIDFSTFLIRPSPVVPIFVKTHIDTTITRLHLNDNDYVEERIEVIRNYSCDRVTLAELCPKYPFLASEIVRQDFDRRFKLRMRTFFLRP